MSKALKSTYEKGKETTQRSFPLLGITFLILLVFKISGIGSGATLSWWWVFAPIYGPFALLGAFLAIVLTGVAIGAVVAGLVWVVARIVEAIQK